MPADPADLTTVEAVKQYLGTTTTVESAEVQRLVTAASKYLVSALSRPVKSASITWDTNGNGRTVLYLPVQPVTAVSSAAIAGEAALAAATPGGTDEGYLVSGMTLVLRGGRVWSRGVLNVRVVYTAGYATVPPEIEQGTIELVAARLRERDRVGIQSRSLGPESVTFAREDLPPTVKRLVDQWRRVVPA